MSGTGTAKPRALCARCLRPHVACVCALLPSLSPRTRVVILQHPRERRVPIGTARMASRCLAGSCVVTGTCVEAHPEVARALADPDRRPVLLWPGPDALDLAAAPPAEPVTLLVVDGTWSTARKMIRMNPAVAALPRYAIAPAAPSQYRIRKEPRAECLSTIEAIATALGVLEGDPERYRAMLAPFREMVDRQLVHVAAGGHPRDKSRLALKRHRPWVRPPELADPGRVVIVAVESNAWPKDAKEAHPDEIVHWLAVRGDESASIEVLARPTLPLSPSAPRHTELAAETILSGVSREDLAAAVRGFLREGDVLATWGSYATHLMRRAGLGLPGDPADLRRVAATWLRGSPGSIERCAARVPVASRVLGRGRGGRRLGQMLAVFRSLGGPPPAPTPTTAAETASR